MTDFNSANPKIFTHALADVVRLPDETVATAYLYIHKYNQHVQSKLDKVSPLDHVTLSLSALHLASLTLSTPRSPSTLLIPAYAILNPTLPVLQTTSSTYEKLRATLMRATTLLSRALGFKLLVSTPFDYLPDFLQRATEWHLRGRLAQDENVSVLDPMGGLDAEERAAQGVDSHRESRRYRTSAEKALTACAHGVCGPGFSARMVAAAVVAVVLAEGGIGIKDGPLSEINEGEEVRWGQADWIRQVVGEKFDAIEWEKCIKAVKDC